MAQAILYNEHLKAVGDVSRFFFGEVNEMKALSATPQSFPVHQVAVLGVS